MFVYQRVMMVLMGGINHKGGNFHGYQGGYDDTIGISIGISLRHGTHVSKAMS